MHCAAHHIPAGFLASRSTRLLASDFFLSRKMASFSPFAMGSGLVSGDLMRGLSSDLLRGESSCSGVEQAVSASIVDEAAWRLPGRFEPFDSLACSSSCLDLALWWFLVDSFDGKSRFNEAEMKLSFFEEVAAPSRFVDLLERFVLERSGGALVDVTAAADGSGRLVGDGSGFEAAAGRCPAALLESPFWCLPRGRRPKSNSLFKS